MLITGARADFAIVPTRSPTGDSAAALTALPTSVFAISAIVFSMPSAAPVMVS
jgi:hypothetical protein